VPLFPSATINVGTAATTPAPQSTPMLRWLLVLVFLIPVIGYIILPLFGIHKLDETIGLNKSLALALAPIGLAFVLKYMQIVLPRPQMIAGFILLAWPPVDAINTLLMREGVNLHLRPLLFLFIAAPACWMFFKHARILFKTVPWLKYYAAFFAWVTLYFIFNNANAMDPHLNGGDESFFEGSVSVIQYTAYFYCLIAVALPALAIVKLKNYRRVFDTLNASLLGISALEALLTIVGYPFGMFCRELDGFTRAMGIFTHPNPFAHHMGVLMVYLLGLLFYYQGSRKNRVASWLVMGGLACNFIAFLLGLSKTALSAFALCSLLMLLLNLAVPAVRRNIPRLLLILLVLAPIGIFGFELLSDKSFFSLIEARVEQTQSLDWRTLIWQELLSDLNLVSIFTGHGFTAANASVFQLSFNDSKNATPLMMVHNAYIALIYDLGILGYLMFAAVGSLIMHSVRGWLQAPSTEMRTGYAISMAMALYFLFACMFDEMSYMFDAPMLFWALVSLLVGVQWREQQEALAALKLSALK
jgi:O-antigen ligase